MTRELYRGVRLQGAASWLQPADLECVLCYHTYTSPVTTPCGHNYCRTCIERSMDYKKSCALCLRSLDDFNLAMVSFVLVYSLYIAVRDETCSRIDFIPFRSTTLQNCLHNRHDYYYCPLKLYDAKEKYKSKPNEIA